MGSHISWCLLAIAATHFTYICDHYLRQEAVLTTTDIKHDQLGFMLAYGLFGFLPWYNTLYALFLFCQPAYNENIVYAIAGCVCQCIVQLLFNIAVTQKHNFREYYNTHGHLKDFKIWGKEVDYVKTPTGSVLLCSGIWGMARHFNFISDMIMCLGWLIICCGGPQIPW